MGPLKLRDRDGRFIYVYHAAGIVLTRDGVPGVSWSAYAADGEWLGCYPTRREGEFDQMGWHRQGTGAAL